jgi:hypothetical protein
VAPLGETGAVLQLGQARHRGHIPIRRQHLREVAQVHRVANLQHVPSAQLVRAGVDANPDEGESTVDEEASQCGGHIVDVADLEDEAVTVSEQL